MMISCEVITDLLPLYADESCSPDSKKIVEEHLNNCTACKRKYDNMKKTEFFIESETQESNIERSMLRYAKKVRRRKFILKILIPFLILTMGFACSIIYEAGKLLTQANKNEIIRDKEDGHDLAESALECNLKEIGKHNLYTDTNRIIVSFSGVNFGNEATVKLWKQETADEPIMVAEVSRKNAECIFTNLLPGEIYRITTDNMRNGTIIVKGK